MMTFLKTAALGVAVVLGASALDLQSRAHAMPVTLIADQEARSNGSAVDPSRTILGNINDGDDNNMFSLGWGGFVGTDVAPSVLVDALTIERTNGTPSVGNYPEAVDIYLGGTLSGPGGNDDANDYDMTDAILVATLENTDTGGGVLDNPLGLTITSSSASGKTTYTINFGSLITEYSTIVLIDATQREFGSEYGGQGDPVSDGWDVARLEVNVREATQPVPLPAGVLLLLSGLLGLGAVGRFRKRVA